MQKAEVVLKILRKKSEQSEEYVFGRLYRNLFNPDFYMLAYNRIHAKEGNMTPGADGKTIDGFNVVLVEKLSFRGSSPSSTPHRSRASLNTLRRR